MIVKLSCFLCFIFSFIFISCNNKNSMREKKSVVLSKNNNTIICHLGENVSYIFTVLFPYYDENGDEYITFLNNRTTQIFFYDVKNGKHRFTLELNKEGPNSVSQMTGYHIQDLNNIYITSYGFNGIIKTDTSGIVLQGIRYNRTEEGDVIHSNFQSRSFFYTPLTIIDNKLYITQRPYNKNISETPVSVVLDTITKTSNSLPFNYPDFMKDGLARDLGAMGITFSREYNGKEFVYSFYYDHNIYITSVDHQEVKKIPAKSRYIDKINIEKKPDDAFVLAKRDLEKAYYGNLIYDKYRDLYYRLAFHEVELDKNIDPIFLTAQGRKKFSIIILNKSFEIVGETVFPEYTYNPYVLFVHKNGLYISSNHVLSENFDENLLMFDCFSVVDN